MIDNTACGTRATSAYARVHAALRHAGQVTGALCVNDTLGSAGRRPPNVVRQTGARRRVSDDATLRVGAAR